MNKDEIHAEVMYKRIFDDLKFTDIVEFFINMLLKSQDHEYINSDKYLRQVPVHAWTYEVKQ